MFIPQPHRIPPTWLRLLALLVGLLAASASWAATYQVQDVPDPRRAGGQHVANPDNVLGAAVQAELETMLAALERDTGAQVAVVAVNQIVAATEVEFAQALFEQWQIGQKGKDNGLLILLVTERRVVRMHTGYGLEANLPDLAIRQIQEQAMVPHFKQGKLDEGMRAGVQRVVQALRNAPTDRPQGLASDPSAAQRQLMRQIATPGLALLGLLGFAGLSIGGHFKGVRASNPIAKGMRWGRISWITLFGVVPAGLVLGAAELAPERPALWAGALLYGHGLLLATLRWWRQGRLLAQRAQAADYTCATQWLLDQQAIWWLIALFFPVPGLVLATRLPAMIQHYRTHPRPCQACGGNARLLSEADEDAHLAVGQQKEEAIRAMDHDVWWCDACQSANIVSFEGPATRYSRCPDCGFKTRHLASDRVLVAATTQASGQGERRWACANCAHNAVEPYTIARLSSADRADSDSSSSSGGNWGGGQSGGGGASARW